MGAGVGDSVGTIDGLGVGFRELKVGTDEGGGVGPRVGTTLCVGTIDGSGVGISVGKGEGCDVGTGEGTIVGGTVGSPVGSSVGYSRAKTASAASKVT